MDRSGRLRTRRRNRCRYRDCGHLNNCGGRHEYGQGITTDGDFSSGWHIHPGPVIVQVQSGYLKITQATCNPNVVGPGETYIETPGVPVMATADKATTWTITEIFPNSAPGDPDRVTTASPCPNG
jgi:hypothetical protein